MGKFKDISTQRFGKLLAIEPIRIEGRGPMYWKCLCDCGNETTVAGTTLREGRCKSCGCNQNQSATLKFKKENPNATETEILKIRLASNSKWVGECLEYNYIGTHGYGLISYKNKSRNASRIAWIAEYGEVPKGMCVCHNCPNGDNRRCINPKHLFLGTHKENTKDMLEKGRDNWQSSRKFPIGTREKVYDLRKKGKLYREIAKEMNMTMDQVKSQLQNSKIPRFLHKGLGVKLNSKERLKIRN